MKKFIFLIIFLVFFAALVLGGNKFFVSAGTAAVYPVDKRFKDFYGTVQFSPELKAGYNFFGSFYLWLGYNFFSASYTVPVILAEANVSQHFLALGAGWETRRGRRLQSDFFAALLLAGFKEQAMGETASKLAPGFEVGTSLRYFLQKRIFLGVSASYAAAWTTARFAEKETDIILGGLRLSGRLGFRF
jgi:hypothetical protein